MSLLESHSTDVTPSQIVTLSKKIKSVYYYPPDSRGGDCHPVCFTAQSIQYVTIDVLIQFALLLLSDVCCAVF